MDKSTTSNKALRYLASDIKFYFLRQLNYSVDKLSIKDLLMHLSLSKLLTLTCMLIAFTAQALAASVMSCDMSADNSATSTQQSAQQSVIMAMQGADNSHHGHHTMAKSEHQAFQNPSKTSDCCQMTCTCPASACVSVSLLSNQQLSTRLPSAADNVSFIVQTHALIQLKSRYRPPIIA